ncbi:MAG: aldo/keto reductase [Magnetococcales bacterium]|nr:aldo/keto reductase [Magnetococcales bacterium]
MEYRPFGTTGLAVSVFTQGGMRFLHGWDAPHDVLPDDSLENVRQVLNASLGAGINLLETARGYGKSERLLGRILPTLGRPRESFHVMSKASPTPTAGEMRRNVEESLQRLGLSFLELYALHGLNTRADVDSALAPGGCLEGLEQAQREGLVGAVGFSSHAPTPLLLEAVASGRFAFVNLHYYFFKRENRPVLDLAAALGMGVLILSPNDKGGLLYDPPPRLRQLTAPLPPVHFNERWLLAHPAIHTLSLGLSEPDHLALHLGSLTPLPYRGATEEAAEKRLAAAQEASPLASCGGCQACLPCPRGVAIPDILRLRHLSETLGMTAFARYRYELFDPADRWMPGGKANRCDDCGDCLPRCPRRLAIPTLMRQVHAGMVG